MQKSQSGYSRLALGSVHHSKLGQEDAGPELPVAMTDDLFTRHLLVAEQHTTELCIGIPGAGQELFLK